jgi:hypothetical protein
MTAELRLAGAATPPPQVALAVASLAGLPLTATYTSFGSPCAGSALRAGSVVQEVNGGVTADALRRDIWQLSAADWLFAFTAPAALQVRGFEVLAALADGPATAQTFLHLDAGGAPSPVPAATGTMLLGRQPGWRPTGSASGRRARRA